MKEHWLSKKDFEQLDCILGRHGFGGYYDLVECLKTVTSHFCPEGSLKEGIYKIKCLPEIVNLLLALTLKKGVK